MKRITLREGIIQVVVEGAYISIDKCEKYDNFDDHGADWELPLDDLEEVKALVELLNQAIKFMESAE